MQIPAALTLATLLACPAAAHAAAVAVEAPTPPTIDGRSGDWGFVTRSQGIRHADGSPVATFRLAYDKERLYALFEVIDDTPLVNGATIHEELIKGGDCVGLALQALKHWPAQQRIIAAQVDGKPMLIAMRPEWKREQKPHTYLSPVGETKMDYVGPVEDAELAFGEIPGGYVAELSLTWKSLNINRRHTIGFDAQVIYGDAAGTTNIDSAWWHTSGGDALTVEDLPSEAALYPEQWGEAKLRTRDPGPDMTMKQDFAPKPAGIPITFDLPRDAMVTLAVTDQDGFVLRELIRAEPMTAGSHQVEWDGRDRYGEVLPSGSYRWKLIHFEQLRSRLIGSVGNSARPPYRTPDGTGSMGGQHGGHSVAAAGPHGVYLMGGTEEGHPSMRAVDGDNRTLWKRSLGGWGSGRAATTVGDDLYMIIGSTKQGGKLVRWDGASGDSREIAGSTKAIELGDNQWFRAVSDLAVIGDVAYISQASRDQIVRIDLTTGTPIDPLTIPAPRATAAVDGALLVCSGSDLVRIDPASGGREPVITDLDHPSAVCLDRQGRIYVAEQGARHQVSRFDAGGTFIDRIGVAGGRPRNQDPYDPGALRQVVALAVGPKDQLWVVEQSWLRRVALFTLDGTHLSDQFGPTAYNTVGPDLDDLSTVYYQPIGGKPFFAETRVDYDAFMADPDSPMDAWSVLATRLLSQTGEMPDGDGGNAESEDEETDLMWGAAAKGYGHIVAFKAANGHRYQWRIAKHNRATIPTGAGIWIERGGEWVPAAYVTNDHKGEDRSWSDANGDGLVQDAERYDPPPTRSFAWLDRDLVLWGREGRLAPTSIDARGVPSYAGAELEPYLAPGHGAIPGGWVFNSMPDEDGAVYFAGNFGTHRHLGFWDRACENQVMKVADGEIKWIVGAHAPKPSNTNPRTHTTLTGIAGVVDGMVIAHDVDHYVAYTDDGLILGDPLLDDELGRQRTGPVAIYIESFTGLFVEDPATGRRVLFSVRSGDDPIIEIIGGGDDIQRQTGTLRIDTSRPRELLEPGQVAIPYETWWGAKGRDYEIDGEAWEWLPHPAGVPVHDGTQVVGDVRLRRDAGSLYVLANALADDAVGATPADAADAWGGSQGVELLLAADSGEPAVRLFLSRSDSGPVALIRAASDASWRAIDGAEAAIRPRWQGYGWRLEAEIPLASLPAALTRQVEQTFRRRKPKDATLINFTEQRLDLVGPLRFNAAIHRRHDGTIQRVPWVVDGGSLAEPEQLDPARWGQAQALVRE